MGPNNKMKSILRPGYLIADRGLQVSCAVVTLRALRDETKTAALETIEGHPRTQIFH